MKPWKTLSRRIAFECEPFLSVELHKVETSRSQIIEDWAWIVAPDYVNVLAQTAAGAILCFRQNKYAVTGLSLAPIGGYIEPGESPESAVERELLEETGYVAEKWIKLGSFPVDANRGAGKAHFFVARNARSVAKPIAGDLEEQVLVLLSLDEIRQALARGEFKTLPWVACVSLALEHLGQPTQ